MGCDGYRATKSFFFQLRFSPGSSEASSWPISREAYEKGKLVFPGKVASLKEKSVFKVLLEELYGQEWVVYCKPPFQNAEMVMDYLGRYTHRVAISNDRLLKLEDGKVTFRYRDRKDKDRIKLMTLDARVHPAVSPAHPAGWVREDQALWNPEQPEPEEETGPVQETAECRRRQEGRERIRVVAGPPHPDHRP